MTDDQRRREIAALLQAVQACRLCYECPAGGPEKQLPHEPRPVVTLSSSARILIAGQAPGKRVHETGLPFNDASGDRLRQWLGIDRDSFYDQSRFAIVPMGFCFPGYDEHGHDLPPRRECAPLWRERIMQSMPQIELILLIGQYAQKWHLGKRRKPGMTGTVEAWREYFFSNEAGPKMLPLPHPSWRNTGWLKKHPWFEADVLPVLKKEVDHLIR
ncbi:uracil-DNA glycosylase family protein [Rhizobium oryziradicis]|uniref:Uracil-DNA glycosylase n=1 Tax=Rhizobium oryziradicis TaxID=1867956 RepID=A0A1Q8ZNP9_9HYPH|nr:uracil-DNA glycosylase family protein [Rhizobium oryziradicis]OLP43396.1 uracil-DNA glycosylase [Rhizobium oryziradicis]